MFKEFVNALIQKGSDSDADDNDNFSGDDYFDYELIEWADNASVANAINDALLNKASTVDITLSKWSEPDRLIHDNKIMLVVYSEGGGEGEGETVVRVFGIFDILSQDGKKFSLSLEDATYFKLGGWYASYEGTTYDSFDDMVAVTPVEKSIIAYV